MHHHHHLVLCEAALKACFLQTQRKKSFFKIQRVREFSIEKTTPRIFCAKCLQPHGLKMRNENEKKVHIGNGREKWQQEMGKLFL